MARAGYAYDLGLEKKKKSEVQKLPELKLLKTNKKKLDNKKFKSSLITSMLFIFTMFMLISCRCNIISEKNLEVQELEKTLILAKSELATSEIKLDKAINMSKIEIYSKGQLGMQKPGKNQMVYLDVQNSNIETASNKNSMFIKIASVVKNGFDR